MRASSVTSRSFLKPAASQKGYGTWSISCGNARMPKLLGCVPLAACASVPRAACGGSPMDPAVSAVQGVAPSSPSPGPAPATQSTSTVRLNDDFGGRQLYPSDNWWNQEITNAPVDPQSNAYIDFIGRTRATHPDFGPPPYGIPFVGVGGSEARTPVAFVDYGDESDAGF